MSASVLAAFVFAANELTGNEAVTLIGWVIVIGCIVGAIVVAVTRRDWVVPLVLLVIAIVAGVLLL